MPAYPRWNNYAALLQANTLRTSCCCLRERERRSGRRIESNATSLHNACLWQLCQRMTNSDFEDSGNVFKGRKGKDLGAYATTRIPGVARKLESSYLGSVRCTSGFINQETGTSAVGC